MTIIEIFTNNKTVFLLHVQELPQFLISFELGAHLELIQ